MRVAWRWPQDRERRSGKLFSQKRRDRRGHTRDPAFATPRPDETEGSSEDRAGSNEAHSARVLDRLESLAHLAWAPSLLRAQAGVQPVRSFQVLSQRENLPAHRSGAKTAGKGGFLAVVPAHAACGGLPALPISVLGRR